MEFAFCNGTEVYLFGLLLLCPRDEYSGPRIIIASLLAGATLEGYDVVVSVSA